MQSTSLAGCSILIVEDELIALDIRSAFEKVSAVALTARSLAVALRLVEHDDLSAAVLDFGLGDGDADALCVRLDQRHIPFILNSGYSQHGPACINGIVIPKPAEPATLVSAVAAFLHCGPQGDPNVHHRSADTAPIFDPGALGELRKSFDATNRIRVHRSIGTHLPHEAEP